MIGTVAILNVGAGDTKLSFDKSNPQERERAKRIVVDLLKRGYALLVQVGMKSGEPIYQRVRAFDPKRCEYVVAGGPDEAIDIGKDHGKATKHEAPAADAAASVGPRRRGRPPGRRVQAEGTRAVAVARSAGG